VKAHTLYWTTVTIGLAGSVSVIGCTASSGQHHNLARQAMIGATKDSVVACAGTPVQEIQTDEGNVLRYYKEAPMFEESTVFSKGSRPGVHHGCWANLLVVKDRIVGAEYRSAPESLEDFSLCEQIFEPCVQ